MNEKISLEQKKIMVAKLLEDLKNESDEIKEALDSRDILLFRSFRMAHPELFNPDNPEQPVCMESLRVHFKEYLLTLSRMGFLSYYLD